MDFPDHIMVFSIKTNPLLCCSSVGHLSNGRMFIHRAHTSVCHIVWDSLEDHKALMQDTETFQKLGASLGPLIHEGGSTDLFHVQVRDSDKVSAQLRAPITELFIQTIKDARKPEELEGHLAAVSRNALSGKVVEHADKWVLVKGWKNVEVSNLVCVRPCE